MRFESGDAWDLAHFHKQGIVSEEEEHSGQVTVGLHVAGPLRVSPGHQEGNICPRVPISFPINRVVKHTILVEGNLGIDMVITLLLNNETFVFVAHSIEQRRGNHAPRQDEFPVVRRWGEKQQQCEVWLIIVFIQCNHNVFFILKQCFLNNEYIIKKRAWATTIFVKYFLHL